jgi:hypothetical protein
VPAASASPLSPVPGTAPAPGWGQRGRKVEPAIVAVLTVVTLGVYGLFYWWRVSREADLLKGHKHAHGLAKTGILMGVLGGLVALLFLVVVLLQVVTLLDPDSEPTEQEIVDALEQAAVPYLAIIVVAALVAAAGGIILYVAMWRSWAAIRDAELSAGRADTVNPPLYLFLPLGLSLAAGVLDSVFALGVVLRLASFALAVAFMAITQSHLNRLWDTGVAAPAPAPVAR